MPSQDRKTVLHVITRLVDGGAQRVVLDMLRVLPSDQWRVVLATGPEVGEDGSLHNVARNLLQRIGGEFVVVSGLRRSALRPFHDLLAIHQLRNLIVEHRPAIVHGHTSKAGMIACVAGRVTGVPSILAPHGHFLTPGAAIPGVPSSGPGLWLLSSLIKLAASCARLVVAPNQVEMEDGARFRLWSLSKSRVVPNGIDLTRFKPRNPAVSRTVFNLPLDQPVVGVIARLSREKGVDLALEAMAKVFRQPCAKSIHLAIAGDGPLRSELEDQAADLGIANRVTFLGRLRNAEHFYSAIDLLVVPSRTEAHGLVATESMACGTPVVAAKIGGLASLVLEGETGLLFPVGNVDAMANAIQDGLSRNWSPVMCRGWVERHWSLEAMGRALEAAYTEVLGLPPPSNEDQPTNSLVSQIA